MVSIYLHVYFWMKYKDLHICICIFLNGDVYKILRRVDWNIFQNDLYYAVFFWLELTMTLVLVNRKLVFWFLNKSRFYTKELEHIHIVKICKTLLKIAIKSIAIKLIVSFKWLVSTNWP